MSDRHRRKWSRFGVDRLLLGDAMEIDAQQAGHRQRRRKEGLAGVDRDGFTVRGRLAIGGFS
jgi:hypothetical protein